MIVKHRRGTTREWQEVNLDIIPEAGELVIEECIDGTRKCKIGTGYTRFSDLPYIDDKTRAELLAEIANAKKYCKNEITKLNTDLLAELGVLEAELEDVETKCYELEKDYIIRDADIKAILEKSLEDAVKLLEDKIKVVSESSDEAQTDLQDKTARIEQLIMAAENRFDTNIKDTSDELRAELREATDDYTAKDAALDLSLRGRIADATAGLAATYDGKYNELNSNITDLSDQVQVNAVNIAAAARRISSLLVSDKNSLVSSDAEVADIRNGFDPENGYAAKTFGSAGDAVRAVGSGLVALDERVENLKSDLSQYIGSKAVTGLCYDINGEVGQCKPYTLYLTAGREVLQNSGVQVLGGAGGGSGSGSGSGGGYLEITYGNPETGDLNIRLGDKHEIEFNFSGKDSSGDSIAQATAEWSLDGVNIANTTVKKGTNRFPVTEYLPNEAGEYTLFLTVTDANQRFTTKTWYINLIELKVTADALDDKQKFAAGKKLTFSYKPFGAIDKTAVIKLDGTVIHTEHLGNSRSGENIPYELPALTHGAHLLDIYLTADFDRDGIIDDSEHSNHVLKDLIFVDSADSRPVIGIAERDLYVDQYSTTKLVYTVYGLGSSSVVDIYEINPAGNEKKVSTTTVTPNKDYKDTPTAVYSYFAVTPGDHKVKFVCGETEKIVNIAVTEVDADIAPITAGLAFDFNPVGRNNGDLTHRDWKYNDISMMVSDNFDWINGGYKPDDPDGPCFCIKAGSTATINYKPFQEEARVKGRELKLVFKTKNISNPEAVFLSCVDNRTDTDHVGVEMGAYAAHIYGKTGNLELAYSEEDVIELEFNIPAAGDDMQMVMGYEDGVPSRPMICQAATSFKQTVAKNITLGSPDCDLYIYRFKVYNTSLSADAILKNYIADARTGEEMISRYNANKIYNNAGALTPESLADACPWLRIYKIESPLFTTSKDDKVKNTVIQQIYKDGDPILDNWTCYNAQHSGQGTSSNNYGAAGRNLDFIMDKEESYFILGDKITKAKSISLTRKSVPVAYLNAKVNIASSNNITNALIAKHYNEFNPYRRPLVERDIPNQAYSRDADGKLVEIKTATPVEYVKDTMEFYNCAIFIRETARDFSTHKEFADDNWHFYALGNIGDSKKTDNTRATDPSDPLECCVEIMDLNLALSAFPRDTMINAMQPAKDDAGNTLEGKYVWATQENIDKGILYTAEYSDTLDTDIIPNKVYYYEESPGKMVNATTYKVSEAVKEYIFAKEENIDNLFVISSFKQTEDTVINYNKVYYVDDPAPEDPENIQKVDAWNYYTVNEDTGVVEYTYIRENPSEANPVLYEAEYTKATSPINVDENIYYYKADDGTMHNAMGYTIVNTITYPYLNDLSALKEIKYTQATGTLDLTATYYIDILEHDDFSEDYTYGWRYSKNKKDSAITGPCHQAWINFYRFVTNSTDEEFKEHFDKYFVKESALYYYLFTTRYCMVDNRAKNTFWHYGKTGGVYESDIEIKNAAGEILFSATAGEPIRKWDLCWDYDNDTSLGLNNYGKQAYRYGLEDIDYEEGTGIEVFRQSDSLFFCRVRDLFAAELKTMYNTLDSQGAWNARAFINESDLWQEQFPEALWHTDIERKYIRPYRVDPQFLENMANGKMKYHRRQWERSQEQYMASKYQTAGSLDVKTQAANFRVNTKAVVNNSTKPAEYSFTLTPYAYVYLNVKYGGTSPVSVRAIPNKAVTIPYHGVTPDIINIGSAAAIRDFGDLSLIYPYTASVQNATKIKTLKLGNNAEGYINTNFTTFATGENALLEELDLTNVRFTGENKTLDLSKLINLKTLKARGTQIQSVTFATGGKISDITLPAVTELSFVNLNDLATDKVTLESYESVVDLTITDCPKIDQLTILERCNKLTRAKLDNVNFGTKTYKYFEDFIFVLQGIDGGTTQANGESTNAQISGTVHFESLTGEQFNELRTRYPNLVITYRDLESTIKFMDTDKITVLTPEDKQKQTNKINCITLGIVPKNEDIEEKIASAEFRYELFGWSTAKDIIVDYNDMLEEEATTKETTDRQKYNEDMLTDIEGDRVFYPVFKAIRRSYNVKFVVATKTTDRTLQESEVLYGSCGSYIGETPIREDVDASEAIRYSFVGWNPKPEETPIIGETIFRAQFVEDELGLADIEYTLTGSTLAIINCKNKLNDAVKVPSKYMIDGKEYTVISIGGFNDYPALELITLPNTLVSFEINAFNMCTSLREVVIPNRVSELAQDAFSRCYELVKVDLQGDITVIGATCFSWCYNLADINLKEGLAEIRSYAFYQSALKNVVLPSTVHTIGENAFGGMNALGTITFRDNDGSLPDIHAKAFADSVVMFRVPWSKEAHIAEYGKSTFGANVNFNDAFIFNYEEENN